MNIIVIHGDHTIKSYERLQKFKKEALGRGWEIIRIDDKGKLSLPEQLTSKSLFTEEALFILEDSSKLTKSDLDWLNTNSKDIGVTLVIYHRGYLAQSVLKSLPKTHKSEEFKLPRLVWKFLESFYPGNIKKCLELLHETVKNEPIEFAFSLLVKQVRDLYWVKIDEKALPYPDWRVGKLKRQAKKFSKISLKKIIKDFAEIDIKVKTSRMNLLDSLDFLIINKLE